MLLKEDVEQISAETHLAAEQTFIKDSEGRRKLRSWLNRNFRIEMTDGRRLIGLFLCTDRDANVILGMCSEFRPNSENDARNLGLVIIKKSAIRKIEVDQSEII
ncbi:hypothetical protein PVAND_010047 [Polypedilum vanderplanki]|uniref:Sm domain-containing protein n=1 Tax=Polypedilum vanderplanki TaxID=319348 RepID=A0A9J6CEK7_POLVA|nr:hypothetical protein PVAND_010047 [Polypedilum vanderplanki]